MMTKYSFHNVAVLVVLGFLSGCSTSLPPPGTKASGAIAGCVLDLTAGPDKMLLAGANVFIPNSEFSAQTGKGGKFIIIDIPPGRYDVSASQVSVHRTTILGVRVAADSVTLITLRTHNLAIPEDPTPIHWDESDKRVLPLRKFLSSGAIFELEYKP